MTNIVHRVAPLFAALLLAACGSDPAPERPKASPSSPLEPAPNDAGTVLDVDAATDARPLPTPCHMEPNSAKVVEITKVAETRPTFTGGTVVDGVYHRTEALVYTGAGGASGPTGKTLSQTIVIKNPVAYVIYRDDGAEDRQTFKIDVSGATIRFAQTCPGTSEGLTPFTGTPTELRIGGIEGGELNVYTRVP